MVRTRGGAGRTARIRRCTPSKSESGEKKFGTCTGCRLINVEVIPVFVVDYRLEYHQNHICVTVKCETRSLSYLKITLWYFYFVSGRSWT